MRKYLKGLSVLLLIVAMSVVVLTFTGCKEPQKYSAQFTVIKRSSTSYDILETWALEQNQTQLEINIQYDGNKYVIEPYSFNLPQHPELGDKWFVFVGYSDMEQIIIGDLYAYKSSADSETKEVKEIYEKGVYTLTFSISEKSVLIEPITITLTINVE